MFLVDEGIILHLTARLALRLWTCKILIIIAPQVYDECIFFRTAAPRRKMMSPRSLVAANMPRGFLPAETVAALQTLAEAQADGQHINNLDEDSADDTNCDGGDSDGFVEEEAEVVAASRKRTHADCERATANMNKHTVDAQAVTDAQADLLDDGQVCCKCQGAGHNGNLLLCDGPKLQQGVKKQQCAIACHTFCCELPLQEVPEGDWFCEACEAGRPDDGRLEDASSDEEQEAETQLI